MSGLIGNCCVSLIIIGPLQLIRCWQIGYRNAFTSGKFFFTRHLGAINTLITDNRSGLDSSVRSLEEVGPALTEFRDLLASLRLITRQLEERPTEYLLGLEPVKEFTP